MIGVAAKLSRGAVTRIGHSFSIHRPPPSLFSLSSSSSPPIRLLSDKINGFNANANHVALQIINYAFSVARSQKSDESYSQALLVLEQCYSSQSDDNSKGMALLALSALSSERENFDEAFEKLKKISDLNVSSMHVRVAATEALVFLHLELAQDDTSSVLADICLQLLETIELEIGGGRGSEVHLARAMALKGLVELVRGNIKSAESFFRGAQGAKGCIGNAVLSCGEFLHAMQNFSMAKELYHKVIQGMSENKDLTEPNNLLACNMSTDEVLLAATCASGQLEAHLGNFSDAEEILTAALKKAEDLFGSHHPDVGVILTCIALMFRHKATMERSSSLLIQEGLYRRAIELLKAPSLDTEGIEAKAHRRDIVALARGGYAEILCVQQNRKAEGERMKKWAEAAWRNHRLSLAEALEISKLSSKVPVIDARISRVL